MNQQDPYIIKKVSQTSIKVDKNAVLWIDNDDNANQEQQKVSKDVSEYYRHEHQMYMAQKIKRKEEERKLKLVQFGYSSSDEEVDISTPTTISGDEVKGLEGLKKEKKYSQITNSKEQQPEIPLVKFTSVTIGSGKIPQNIDRIQIFINSKKGVDIWIEQQLRFKDKSLKFSQFQVAYYDINKLKVIFTDTGDSCFKLKINWKNQEFIFAASYSKSHCGLPNIFYIFSKVLNEKMNIMGKKMNIAPSKQGFPQVFIKNSYIYGKLFKKSRIISRWSDIFTVINKQGLYYYKKLVEKGDLLIPRTSISELWTRFDFHNQFLVMKLFQHNSKIELAVPVYNFMALEGWIYNLYGLIFKNG